MYVFVAQTLYDPDFISVYNVIYTSLPVVALAILDQVSHKSHHSA
jgi:phospholipid-translocating ATPase